MQIGKITLRIDYRSFNVRLRYNLGDILEDDDLRLWNLVYFEDVMIGKRHFDFVLANMKARTELINSQV